MTGDGRLQTEFSLTGQRVWVAGHRGMVGSGLVRRLAAESCEVITCDRQTVDLRRQQPTEEWLAANKPDVIFIAAATVGGIHANASRPAEFLYDNLSILTNIIEAAHRIEVRKLLLLGSSCIYPRLAPQPISEDALLTGPLEPTNQWYAIAKIAGVRLCQSYRQQYGRDFISAMPTNLYGPGDTYDLESGHVIPALVRKFHEAHQRGEGEVTLWGTGKARREFLYVEDCANALVHLMKTYSGAGHINVGTGTDLTISELAETIARTVGYEGTIVYDTSKPDGTPRKLLDLTRLHGLGWEATTRLEEGLRKSYAWFQTHIAGQ